jgi:endonuclease/exonuclease/phosphatase family metal-dependent hydrolase
MVISSDTLHLFVNHWPSMRGGVLNMENLRIKIAEMVRSKVDSIMNENRGGAKIIILGDFNCTPDDQVIRILLATGKEGKDLINLSAEPASKGLGTYRYQGNWEMLDQIIVSEKILSCAKGIYTETGKFAVFKPDFLLKKDPKYPGSMPLSTYRGYKYQGGFSDHLPVLLDLKIR